MKKLFFFLTIIVLSNNLLFGQSDITIKEIAEANQEECTIGVAIGTATSDGRPLLWKTRDYASSPDNEVKYNTSYQYKFISVSNAGSGTYSWMGVNEYGFAIVNSLSEDLVAGSSGPSNGALMRDVLGNCQTVAEFQNYLDSTNITTRTTCANFAVIDSTGAGAIFETAGSEYWKFDAANSPNGYVIRTNFSINGGSSEGIERYNRSTNLINNFYNGDSLNYKSIIRYQMRDFSDFNSDPVPVPFPDYWISGRPYGYIFCDKSICRQSSVSAAVIHGVLTTEFAGLSTMWTILGHPASSVAIPYWPVGDTPVEADGPSSSALCDKANEIRTYLFDYPENINYIDSYKLLDDMGAGLWTCTFPLEDYIFSNIEPYMDSLRANSTLAVNSMLNKESSICSYALSQLQNCSNLLSIETVLSNDLISVFPNPNNGIVNIKLGDSKEVSIKVFNLNGQLIHYEENINSLIHQFEFNEAAGVYILELSSQKERRYFKLIKE